jgi:hypothetical protein
MRQCEFAKDSAAGRRQPNPNSAPIPGSGAPHDRARKLEAVYQFHGAVVLNEQSRGNLPDRRVGALRQAVHGKQQLMLPRLNAVFLRGSFAEMEEPPDLPAELGQIAILAGSQIARFAHICIVSRSIMEISTDAASKAGKTVDNRA